MAPTGQKKVFQTADALWQVFDTVTADLGPGSDHARGTVPLHPTGHWRDDEAVEFYGKKVFDLEDVQIMRSKNWLEQGLRRAGVRDYWVLQRVIAATMEYTVTDFEHLMRVFFVEWEKDLKPDGRTNRNKDQWTRWCEIHLVRHHRSSKAVRCLNVLEALGLLFPGWWKQVYALNNNTAIHNDTYASPWDLHPSPNAAEMDELNQKYARVPHPSRAQVQAAPQVIQQNTPVSRAVTHKKNKNKRQKTAQFQEDLDELDDAFDATTQAQAQPDDEVDIKSEESFTPEDYYPDYVHEYDAVMGKPATTHPQLPHTVSFAPGAEAWRNMNDSDFDSATRFNPEINATRIIDSAAMDAVPAPPRAHVEPAARPVFGPERPPTGPAAARPQPTPTAAPQPSINWLDLDERDFARAVTQVDADFPQLDALRPSGPVADDTVAADPAVYAAVAGYKGVAPAEAARTQAARRAAGGPVAAASGDEEVIWGFDGEHDGAPEGPAAPSSGAALKLPRWPVRQ
ncbi:hypothetical protein E4T48_02256 [Aureobasidium sp. EXF-10727]|nr:hypothetical protein E4T48_02256 [Aureobasidium sp. EXF-10727]KAI4724102.1 hypothetical protein E4T49_08154 [Aureobasidium sp. EXF-10728]